MLLLHGFHSGWAVCGALVTFPFTNRFEVCFFFFGESSGENCQYYLVEQQGPSVKSKERAIPNCEQKKVFIILHVKSIIRDVWSS